MQNAVLTITNSLICNYRVWLQAKYITRFGIGLTPHVRVQSLVELDSSLVFLPRKAVSGVNSNAIVHYNPREGPDEAQVSKLLSDNEIQQKRKPNGRYTDLSRLKRKSTY